MSWIFYTIAAVILQTFRNLEQKSLAKKLDSFTVSWSRFILPLPFALAVLLQTFQAVNQQFVFYCIVTAVMQIAGNIFLLQTFKSKNFSIGIAFYKTEVLQALLIGMLFFHAEISAMEIAAILVTTAGVIMMSGLVFNGSSQKFLQSLKNPAAFFGLLCGFCFSISAFSLKFAAEELYGLGFTGIKPPLMVLMWVIFLQNILFIAVKLWQKRLIKDWRSLFSAENKSSFLRTSLLSFAGSVCWFIAFALGSVIHIKAVGQLELVLAILASYFILQERPNKLELAGIALTALGILWLIFEQL